MNKTYTRCLHQTIPFIDQEMATCFCFVFLFVFQSLIGMFNLQRIHKTIFNVSIFKGEFS